jgi:hypothetical protein
MTIKRFQDFPNKNEDTILDECGWPEALPWNNDFRFYNVSDKVEFLFVEEEDIEWRVNPDAFSIKERSYEKTLLVNEIESKDIVVFVINEGKRDYAFYGIYKLSDPYTNVSGAGKVIDVFTPLEFYLEREEYMF